MPTHSINSHSDSTAETPDSSERKVAPPKIEELGTIEELTRGTGAGTLDLLGGGGGGFEDGDGGDGGMS